MEYIEEEREGIGVIRRPATRWRNDTHQVVQFRIIDAEAIPRKHEGGPWSPQKILRYKLAPGDAVLIPSEHDESIMTTRCTEFDCTQGRACKDRTHSREVFGGLAVGLTRVNGSAPVTVHPVAAHMATPPAPTNVNDLDARLMKRAAQKAGVKDAAQ